MGPKYEFTDETMNYDGHILHRIKRLSDGKLGGWIKKEENLSQEGNCWVDDDAKVYGDAQVYGNAYVYDDARVFDNAHVYDYASVSDEAWVSGNAKVRGNALIHDDAYVYGNAQVYDDAYVCGNARVYGDAEVYGNAVIYNIWIDSGKYSSNDYKENSSKEVIQDFIYKVDDSNKITTQTEYNSINEFFNTSITNDIKLDTLVICTVDSKEPLIKLQKVEMDSKTEFKFIVDLTNEDGDNFIFKSIIKSQEQLNQLIQQTIDMLKQSPQFVKYVDDLESCL